MQYVTIKQENKDGKEKRKVTRLAKVAGQPAEKI